ncbi:MAG: ATP-grasp domain-containing protein [bacterium]|nr:ATP-grasp domain-containing protein [bacterium]
MTEKKNETNLLIASAGRRTKLVTYFKEEFREHGRIVLTDCDATAPALYFGDSAYIVPRISSPDYIATTLGICKKENISGILTLIDPEISLLAKHKKKFEEIGIKVFASNYTASEICFDKFDFYNHLTAAAIATPLTFDTLPAFERALKKKEIDFPVFVKPGRGSASIVINVVREIKEATQLFERYDDLIVQEHMGNEEYGIDVYVDLISNEIISIFAKKKIRMRAGETDKAVSIIDEELFRIVVKLVKACKLRGPIDVDVFKKNGRYYISEINPRFGGGYPLAYECGVNFPAYIKNNMTGHQNEPAVGKYEEGIVMMKHDTVLIKKEKELIK